MRTQGRLMLSGMLALLIASGLLSVNISADDDANKARDVQPTPYNPYPPGILPADLDTEIARVRREVQLIFNQAVTEWHALPPVKFAGLPPAIQGNGYEAMRVLGKLLNFDESVSVFKNQACASCHMPY